MSQDVETRAERQSSGPHTTREPESQENSHVDSGNSNTANGSVSHNAKRVPEGITEKKLGKSQKMRLPNSSMSPLAAALLMNRRKPAKPEMPQRTNADSDNNKAEVAGEAWKDSSLSLSVVDVAT
jgi:hypothetical protein